MVDRFPRLRLALAPILLLAGCAAADRPGTATGPPGSIAVSSSPAGARIVLDGTALRLRTPATLDAAPGRHRVLLSLPGHRGWEKEVTVEPGGAARLKAVLLPLGSGSLGISSVPSEAQVFLDGQPTGQATPAELRDVEIGTHTIQLRREGYEIWSQAVVVMQDRRLQVQASLAPTRRNWGHFQIQSHPARAKIYLDGYPTGKSTPDIVYNVLAGSHEVDLVLEGYRVWSGSIVVRENRTGNLLVTLQRLPLGRLGAARIESDPPGARITLNGVQLRQSTPADLEYLAAGTFPLELELPGFVVWHGQLVVTPGRRAEVTVKLRPKLPGE